MNNPNMHIEEFLEYYYAFEKEPGYAVLLKGKWGTGKTWFVNQTLKRLEQQGGRYLYVSLYGLTSFDQIEDEFFKQLHPLLTSKSMALTGKIAKGLLKATLKIDLDQDGKDDGTISPQLPELKLPDYLTNTSGFILVFDDLERASINLESLLGYINHYVEHQGYKAIIVANEEEILAQQEEKKETKITYRRTKEKLVGKSFEITPDLNGALINFISEIKTPEVKRLYESNIELISEIYNSSSYQNLRHLKQALWDFERLTTFVSKDAMSKNGLHLHILRIFLMFSFEIKSGNILPEEISALKSGYWSSLLNQASKDTEDSPYHRVSKKYKSINFLDFLLEESIWVDFFNKGLCSEEKIQESLEKSEYFRSENTPDWVKLWHSMELTDEEFDKALSSVKKDFYEMKFTQVGEITHIVGIMLWLSNINLISDGAPEILEFSKNYISNLKEKGSLIEGDFNRPAFRDRESWGGLGFHGKDSEHFKEFCQYQEKLYDEAKIEAYPKIGSDLLDLIDADPHLFYRRIVHCNDSDNFFYEIPILSYIDSDKFVDSFISATSDAKRTVCYAISRRYEFDSFNSSLLPELNWLRTVTATLEKRRKVLTGKISGYQLQSYIQYHFGPAIEVLGKHETK